MGCHANIPVVFLMMEKLKSIFTALGAILPKPKTTEKTELDDGPDYRYADFRDEIEDVERIRTIGGKHGKEKS